MPRNEQHDVGTYWAQIPTEHYETLMEGAKAQLRAVELQLVTDPDARDDFRIRTALEVSRDNLKKALGIQA